MKTRKSDTPMTEAEMRFYLYSLYHEERNDTNWCILGSFLGLICFFLGIIAGRLI